MPANELPSLRELAKKWQAAGYDHGHFHPAAELERWIDRAEARLHSAIRDAYLNDAASDPLSPLAPPSPVYAALRDTIAELLGTKEAP